MAGRDPFVDEVLQLLEPLGAVSARSMFGGHGVYFDGAMFALIAEGRLFFKTDELNRAEIEAVGGEPFVYHPGNDRKPVAMSYWTPPAEAVDDSLALLPWARRGVEAAARARLKKSKPASRRPCRAGEAERADRLGRCGNPRRRSGRSTSGR